MKVFFRAMYLHINWNKASQFCFTLGCTHHLHAQIIINTVLFPICFSPFQKHSLSYRLCMYLAFLWSFVVLLCLCWHQDPSNVNRSPGWRIVARCSKLTECSKWSMVVGWKFQILVIFFDYFSQQLYLHVQGFYSKIFYSCNNSKLHWWIKGGDMQ